MGIINIQAVNAQDTTAKALKLININSKRSVPQQLPAIENTLLYSGKKNAVLKLNSLDANLVTNNARQIFARIPGITIWENDGSGTQISVAIRGLNPNRSWEFNTRQNGYDISSDVYGYPEAYYNPPLEAVDKIQIISGGASLQYGAQFGGLLNYVLKRETEHKPFTFQTQTALGSFGLLSNYTAIGGNTKKVNYYIYNHYRKGNGWRENGEYEVRNTHAYIKYLINPQTSISAEYTNSNNLIQQSGGLTDIQFEQDDRQSVRSRNWFSTPWQLASIHFESKLNSRVRLDAKIFGLLGERSSVGFVSTPNIMDTINLSLGTYNPRQVDRDFYKNAGTEIKGLYNYSIGEFAQYLSLGFRAYQANMIRNQKGKGDVGADYQTEIQTSSFPTSLNFQTNNFAVFIENKFEIQKRFSITPGIRLESISSKMDGKLNTINNDEVLATPMHIKRNVVLAGLCMEYQMNSTTFYTNISQAYRPVLASELVPPATTDSVDANLKDASGYNSSLGYKGIIGNGILNFDLSVFRIQYNNRIGTIRKFIDENPANETYQLRTNLGKSYNQGFEAYIDLNVSKLGHLNKAFGSINLFASIAFIKARYVDFVTTKVSGSAPNIIVTEYNYKNNKVEYAPEQIHNLGITYAIKGFSTTLQTRISTDVFTDASNTESPNAGATTGKIDGYHIFDYSLEYRFLKMYNAKLSINNVSDTKYTTRRSGGYPGPGLLPGEGRTFTLSFGVKI